MMKHTRFIFTVLFLFLCVSLNATLGFDSLSITKNNDFLFCTNEQFTSSSSVKTLYRGIFNPNTNKIAIEALSYYPDNMIFHKISNKIYIQNKTGLYSYDLSKQSASTVGIYPGLHRGDEYPLYRLEKVAISPNDKFIVGKIASSPTTSDLFLYDTQNNITTKISNNIETKPGMDVAKWSSDSNYFIYQKNGVAYYYSIVDYRNKKQLTEEVRQIGKVNLDNCVWTDSNYLIWIENDIIWMSDPAQFFSRSIYGSYLRQGQIIGKLPFKLNVSTDKFIYNEISQKFIIVNQSNAIFYYSLQDDMQENPYLRLDDNSRFDNAIVFDSGNSIFTTKTIHNGNMQKNIYFIKKMGSSSSNKSSINNTAYKISAITKEEFKNSIINDVFSNESGSQIVVCCSAGAFCYNTNTWSLQWAIKNENILSAQNIGDNRWILGGQYLIYQVDMDKNIIKPILASSIDDGGFVNEKGIGIFSNGQKFLVDAQTKVLTQIFTDELKLYKNTQNASYRLLSRNINMGFYKQGLSIKELASGKSYDVTTKPNLRYKLAQIDGSDGSAPAGQCDIALVFDCIKSSEGMFPIMETIANYKCSATFFVNGAFMDINKTITKELSSLNVEIGNLFQYYVNLTNNNFSIDRNFIRQGLSTNEEKYFSITGKNFDLVWHAPMYMTNNQIISFAQNAGYRYITYSYDSSDNVDKKDDNYPNSKTNAQIIDKIVANLAPGQIIKISTGCNDINREEWLFDDFDLLLSEILRCGYELKPASSVATAYGL